MAIENITFLVWLQLGLFILSLCCESLSLCVCVCWLLKTMQTLESVILFISHSPSISFRSIYFYDKAKENFISPYFSMFLHSHLLFYYYNNSRHDLLIIFLSFIFVHFLQFFFQYTLILYKLFSILLFFY